MIGNDLRCPGMCTVGSCWLGCSGPCAEHGTPQSNSLASELSTRNARLLTLSNFRPSLSCILRDFATMLTCHASPFWGYFLLSLDTNRLNIELESQSLFGLHACAQLYSLAEIPQPLPPPPHPHLGSYTRALLLSQDRWHLFVTTWLNPAHVLLYIMTKISIEDPNADLFKLRGLASKTRISQFNSKAHFKMMSNLFLTCLCSRSDLDLNPHWNTFRIRNSDPVAQSFRGSTAEYNAYINLY